MKQLYPHQRELLSKATGSTLPLFWEMRLGKTLTAIRWIKAKGVGHTLVVCPLPICFVWIQELAEERLPALQLVGSPDERLQLVEAFSDCNSCVFVTNYESLMLKGGRQAKPSPIAKLPWDCVLLDESTAIRNPRSKTSKIACKWLAQAPYRGVLSGCPNPESALDLVQQMIFLERHALGYQDYWTFRQKCCKLHGFKWRLQRTKEQPFKQFVNSRVHWLKKKDVGGYTKKVFEQRRLELPANLKKQYRRIEEEFVYEEKQTQWVTERRTWCTRLASGFDPDGNLVHDFKLKELKALLEGELRNERCLILCRFTREIEEIAKRIDCVTVKGGDDVGETIRRWKSSRKHFVCQTRCVSHGVSFAFLDTVIYFSRWDDIESRLQSLDRLTKKDSSQPVLVVDLLTQGTVDEDIYNALQHKVRTIRSFRILLNKEMRKRWKSR